jgi:hypothetical protein
MARLRRNWSTVTVLWDGTSERGGFSNLHGWPNLRSHKRTRASFLMGFGRPASSGAAADNLCLDLDGFQRWRRSSLSVS